MYLTAAAVSLGKPTLSLSAEVRELFERAPWRGNLRELETVCEVLTLTVPPPGPALPSDLAVQESIPGELRDLAAHASVARLETVRAVFEQAGTQKEAAQRLGVSVRTVQRRLREASQNRGAASDRSRAAASEGV